MVIKGLKFIMLVKNIVIIHTVNPQYVLIAKVVNVNCRCYGYKVQNRRSGALFLLFFYLPLYTLLLLNLFLKLK